MNVTFVFDEIIVTTTVDVEDYRENHAGIDSEDSDEALAVDCATAVIGEYGLQADRAGEIQVDGEIYEG